MNFDALQRAIRGTVTMPGDGGYEGARNALLWNGRKPARRPQAIVAARDARDVQATVRLGAAAGARLSARGRGHHWSGIALQDGIVLDLGAMNRIDVDAARGLARVGPTATNGELLGALAPHGLAFPAGHCASVPLSGYLLGGGFGWNAGAWGIACHSVESVELVLADGSLVTASATENPDIFWAVRGAGPEFFGIVTAYTLRLHPLPRAIRTEVRRYPLEEVGAVERWMSATMAVAPRNVEFTAVMSSAPPQLADRAKRIVAAVATVFADDEAEAGATLALVRAGAPQGALDASPVMETPFPVLYAIIDQFFPEGQRYAADTNWSAEPAGLMASLAGAVEAAPSPASLALAVVLPPADRPLPDAAFSMAGPAFGGLFAAWQEAAEDEANLAWLRRASGEMAALSLGHYIGEADLDLLERSRRSFAPAAFERLRALQRRYDPAGLFHRPGLDGEGAGTSRARSPAMA